MLVAAKRLRLPRRNKKNGRYSPAYWLFRKEVLKRDCFQCQFPGCLEKKNLEVHHIKKYAESARLRTEKSNGITLCKKHHAVVTGKEESFEAEFFKIICAAIGKYKFFTDKLNRWIGRWFNVLRFTIVIVFFLEFPRP